MVSAFKDRDERKHNLFGEVREDFPEERPNQNLSNPEVNWERALEASGQYDRQP